MLKNLHFSKGRMLLIGLAMAIGWGIRGNFGHQYGAAFAGCLATLTMCLLSGREDWKGKVLYFAFFGAIGWGFGATVSYMQVIAYCESGNAATQYFGYLSLFVIGFLWASLGVAATALAAAASAEVLSRLFKVILYVFAMWLVLDYVEDPIANALQPAAGFDATAMRQKNPLYWLDANYLPPCFALIAACIYDAVNRREKNILWLPVFAIAGAFAGWLAQYLVIATGWEDRLSSALTFRLGDLSYIDPATGVAAYKAEDLLTNWPQWFADYPHAIGWFAGLIAGMIIYFRRFGKFRDGASLVVYMAGGWLIFFLIFPVLGSLLFKNAGGIRMTPPRSDDWAGILGVVAGAILWLRKNNYLPVVTATLIGGAIGGLGFSGVEWLKQLMMAPGNPRILAGRGLAPGNPAYDNTVSAWAHWQHQNWHSFLEQSYGFINGLAIAVAMGLLAKRLPLNRDQLHLPFRRWMLGICTVFTLLVIPYVNIFKNVESFSKSLNQEVWTRAAEVNGVQQPVAAWWDVPYLGRLPGFTFFHLTPEGWFNATWLLLLMLFIALIRKHFQQPIALVPLTWTGRSQLILMVLLWIMIWGNFDRNIINWGPERLLTDWVVIVDAIVLTYFTLTLPRQTNGTDIAAPASFVPLYRKAWKLLLAAIIVSAPIFLLTNRWIYHYSPNEVLNTRMYHLRFGPNADWRARPILKNHEHK